LPEVVAKVNAKMTGNSSLIMVCTWMRAGFEPGEKNRREENRRMQSRALGSRTLALGVM
jgi:hypothetical protein